MAFRKLILATGRTILSGKDSKTNDELVSIAKGNDTLLHTKQPGSPFVNCGENPTKEELNEAVVFCAKYSQDWKKNNGDVVVNIFLKKNTKKDNLMKEGTWSVHKADTIKVKKEDILKVEDKEKLKKQ